MSGFNQDVLKDYVPALVYTMYDGYYIYSPYTNKLDNRTKNDIYDASGMLSQKSDAEILNSSESGDVTYYDGQELSGMKPYIYYSCRYIYNGNDFVITYSLDNYITIQGVINNKWVYDAGYLLDNIVNSGGTVTYRNIQIEREGTQEAYIHVLSNDGSTYNIEKHEYIKINGVKYYKDTDGSWFYILNNKKVTQTNFNPSINEAIEYYKDAYNFKQKLKGTQYTDFDGQSHNDGYGISDLTTDNAVDEQGNKIYELNENGQKTTNLKFGNYKIFDFGKMDDSEGSIEDPDSNFNQHRLAVIRYSIEKNLSIAISNYNKYSSASIEFMMPNLSEEEWDRIINNISIISFLQGLSIGGKIYNGYAIVMNNKNEEVVQEDSIYILTSDRQYHKVDDEDLINNNNIISANLNIDFEVRTVAMDTGNLYYIPKGDKNNPITGCYKCIVNNTNENNTDNYYEYVAKAGGTLATKYFTALGRERYGIYRNNIIPQNLDVFN